MYIFNIVNFSVNGVGVSFTGQLLEFREVLTGDQSSVRMYNIYPLFTHVI